MARYRARTNGSSVKSALLTGGAAIAFSVALGMTGAAFAQDDEDKTDEIVVSGFRSSIESSVAAKRDNQSIVEAVSAEEIGKLPDVSIAESLGRLPGLATQRLNGRSNVLSIRGLGPDLSTALLNGREQVTTSDNRGVEFDQYPAELLSQAIVYKTPYAGLVGQGLAGTVDLRTIRPLDKSESVFAVSGRYEFNEDGSLNPDSPSGGYRATATYIDQFADDTIGFAVGLSLQSSPSQQEQFNAWGYASDGSGNLLIGGAKPFAASNDLDRIGGFATLEFAPREDFKSTIDFFYSDFNEDQRLRGIEFPLGFGGGFGVTNGPTTASANGFATAGSFNNVRGVVRNDLNVRRASLLSTGWNGSWDSDGWGVDMDISYSRARRHDDLIESYSGTGFGSAGGVADTIFFNQAPGGVPQFTGSLDYGDTNLFVLTDPLGWGGGVDVVQAGFINAPETTDELWHLRGSVNRDIDSFIKNIEIGADFGMREKSRNIDQQFLTLAGGPLFLSQGAVQSIPIPAGALLGEFTGLSFLGLPNQVTYDPLYLLANGVYRPLSVELSSFSVAQDWTVSEDVWTGWAKLDIDSNLGSIPVTGNVGVQIVHTDQESNGFRIPTSGVVSGTLGQSAQSVTDGDKYTHWLPSLNLIFGLSENTKLRLGASRTLARPRMDQLNASLSLSTDVTGGRLTSTDPFFSVFSANGGNARLRPYISNQVDLSLEHYFGRSGYISIAGFYKDLNDFVNPNDAFIFDFAGFVGELSASDQALLGTTLGTISGPTNNGFGKIKGIEASVSLPLENISERLSAFGLLTSASFTDSAVTWFLETNPANRITVTVPGLSKWVINSTAYFESGGFEARVSHRYRSEFLAEVAAISATRSFRNAQPESIIDAQIGYQFRSGALEGLRLTAQGLNLTDEPFITNGFDSSLNNDPRQLIDHQRFGRTYLIGASYSF